MFEGAARGRSAAGATTWINDVRPCWNLAGECLQVLKERDLLRGRVGLAGLPRLMPFADWRVLTGGLESATLVDAEPQVDALRAIKSPRELAQIAHATRLVHDVLARVPSLGPAPDEMALAAGVIREARRRGAEDIRIALGRHAMGRWVFAPPQHAPLATGDRIAVDVAASWERYWSETTRTFDVRADGLAPAWNAETEARFHDIASHARPGAVVADLVTAREAEVVAVEGYGIGITPEEPPALTYDSTMALQSGMVLVVTVAMEDAGRPIVLGESVTV
jgi:Xaa-Pro aminopeptidase